MQHYNNVFILFFLYHVFLKCIYIFGNHLVFSPNNGLEHVITCTIHCSTNCLAVCCDFGRVGCNRTTNMADLGGLHHSGGNQVNEG